MRISIEQHHPDGLHRVEVSWPVVPVVGDSVDMQDPETGESMPEDIAGRVKSRVFWADGSVRIVLEPTL